MRDLNGKVTSIAGLAMEIRSNPAALRVCIDYAPHRHRKPTHRRVYRLPALLLNNIIDAVFVYGGVSRRQ